MSVFTVEKLPKSGAYAVLQDGYVISTHPTAGLAAKVRNELDRRTNSGTSCELTLKSLARADTKKRKAQK
jgi:hypothetical protein